ncbi:MAG TPA: aa3-type cytochrome c oxidase subunit IV [Rhizomicrobium sp.]|nr:aa3-type cytochrome c oxidase subunit IV [Rhizomicrobium sp.]
MSDTDMKEHLRTWHGFMSFVKWMIIANVGLLIFLAYFRTHD